jgi:tetratricopeptide (TPR) repeat protein/pimeloyl-ACP methyl ester carboxylesterase
MALQGIQLKWLTMLPLILFPMADLYQVSKPFSVQEAIADLIFIHGLGGDADSTWRNRDEKFDWTEWVAEQFKNCRVWKVSYKSHAFVQIGMAFQDQAKAIADAMLNQRLGDRPIILICHSLGGILAKQVLRASERSPDFLPLFAAIKGVIFIATPHSGSSLANVIKCLSAGSVQLRQLAADEPSLRDLDEWFRQTTHRLSLHVAAFAETRPTHGVTVVSLSSADPKVTDCTVIPLPADHMSIAKPSPSAMQLCDSTARLITSWLALGAAVGQVGGRLGRIEHDWPATKVNLPPKTNFFTGRSDILRSIDEHLMSNRAVVLTGIQGVGKTQVALEYVFSAESAYQWIFWVDAESSETLIAGFREIAKIIIRPDLSFPASSLASMLRLWFENNREWLLVLDNFSEAVTLSAFLTYPPNGFVLATGIVSPTSSFTSIDVPEMPLDDAIQFLLRRSGVLGTHGQAKDLRHEEREDANQLAVDLGCLPLALDQAGAFIHESSSDLKEYRELYRKEGAALRALRGSQQLGHPSVSITFSLASQKLKQENQRAFDLITLCAFMGPEAIPEEVIGEGLKLTRRPSEPGELSDVEMVRTYGAIARLGLVRRNASLKTLQIHRLVQAVIREDLGIEDHKYWMELTARALFTALDDPHDEDVRFDRAMSHVQHVADSMAACGITIPDWYPLLMAAGVRLHTAARYEEAKALYFRGYEQVTSLFGESHKDAAILLNNIGEVYRAQGCYEDAEKFCQRSAAIWNAIVGPDSLMGIQTLNSLALICSDTGRLDEARQKFEKSLSLQRAELGVRAPASLHTMNNLATCYRELGLLQECKSMCKTAQQIASEDSEHRWENLTLAFTRAC